MKLTLCGTGAGSFTAQRASSGYVLESEGHSLLLDCGPGSLRNALQAGIALENIDAIFLSHIHEDHCFDLGALAMHAMYRRFQRMPTVFTPPGTSEVVIRLMTLHRASAVLPPIEVVEIDSPDEREVCGFVVRSEETPHGSDLRAFSRRFTSGGRSFVFSGDTHPNPDLMATLARDADLLLHEAYSRPALERYAALGSEERRIRLLERMPATHSDLGEVTRIATDTGARRLVLTHLLPTEVDADMQKKAAELFKGDLTVARDGLSIEF